MRKKFGNGNIVKGGLGAQSVKYGLDTNYDITAADPKARFIAKNKKAGGGMIRQMYKKGKSVKKGYHKTKDGRTVKKGLYYYMNRRKKAGTSRKGKGTVTDKALKRSAKTAKA